MHDLLVELFEDKFEENPLEQYRGEDGEVQFTDTGDDLLDYWETLLASGQTPDLTQAFTPEALKKIAKLTSKPNSGLVAQAALADSHVQKLINEQMPKPRTFR